MKNILSLFVMLFAFTAFASAQGIEGTWKTFDDETGEAKSHVKIYEQGGKYYGKVVKILTDKKDATCTKCKGDQKDQPVLNMVIITDMEKVRDNAMKGGRILDPNKGKDYKCEIYLQDDGTLKMKGCVGPICRGQVWERVS